MADETVTQNENGGFQSDIGVDFTLFDIPALLATGKVFAEGAKKYARDNWKLIEEQDHWNHVINHALRRIEEIKTGIADGEDHAAHASCRSQMALAMKLSGGVTTDPEELKRLKTEAAVAVRGPIRVQRERIPPGTRIFGR